MKNLAMAYDLHRKNKSKTSSADLKPTKPLDDEDDLLVEAIRKKNRKDVQELAEGGMVEDEVDPSLEDLDTDALLKENYDDVELNSAYADPDDELISNIRKKMKKDVE